MFWLFLTFFDFFWLLKRELCKLKLPPTWSEPHFELTDLKTMWKCVSGADLSGFHFLWGSMTTMNSRRFCCCPALFTASRNISAISSLVKSLGMHSFRLFRTAGSATYSRGVENVHMRFQQRCEGTISFSSSFSEDSPLHSTVSGSASAAGTSGAWDSWLSSDELLEEDEEEDFLSLGMAPLSFRISWAWFQT